MAAKNTEAAAVLRGCMLCNGEARGVYVHGETPDKPGRWETCPTGCVPSADAPGSAFKAATSVGVTTAAEAEHRFATGAKRSEVKPYYCAIPGESMRRLAMRATGAPKGAPPLTLTTEDGHTFHYAGGSRGYGYGNWRRGLPMQDTFNHTIEHLYRWKDSIERGEIPNDDDLAAAAWGILMPLMTFEADYAAQCASTRVLRQRAALVLGPNPEDAA